MRDAILSNYVLEASLPIPAPEKTDLGDGKIYVWVPRAPASSGATKQGVQGQ